MSDTDSWQEWALSWGLFLEALENGDVWEEE